MSTWTHTRTISLMSERASRNKGKQVEVRGEGGEDCGKRGRRERRSGVSPGELQTSVTQHSLSTVAGRLLLLLVERHKAQKVSSHTHIQNSHKTLIPGYTHMLPWLCHHSNTVTPALQLHSRAWSPAGFWGRGGVNLSIFSWLTFFCAGDNKTFSKVRFTLHQAIQVPCTSTWCELGMNVGKWENEEKAGSTNRGGKKKGNGCKLADWNY